MTVKRMTFLQELLGMLGLQERVHLAWISSAEAQRFVQVVTEFTEKIKSLGPSPLSGDFDLSAIASSCEAAQDAVSVEGG